MVLLKQCRRFVPKCTEHISIRTLGGTYLDVLNIMSMDYGSGGDSTAVVQTVLRLRQYANIRRVRKVQDEQFQRDTRRVASGQIFFKSRITRTEPSYQELMLSQPVRSDASTAEYECDMETPFGCLFATLNSLSKCLFLTTLHVSISAILDAGSETR